MPIYEYNCSACKNKFELLRPFSKCEEDAECPQCKKPSKRAISKFVSHMKDAAGASIPASSGGGCGSCSSNNCASCHR